MFVPSVRSTFHVTMNTTRSRFHLQVVTDRIMPPEKIASILIGVLDAGADSVQIRDTAASPAEAAALVHVIEHSVPDARDRLVIHQLLSGSEMVGMWRHMKSAFIESHWVTERADGFPFGASVHTYDGARKAVELGAAYVTFGHVFWTRSHPGEPPQGITALADVVRCVDAPVLAIGGITPDNLDQVLATGCAGVAVISAVIAQVDPAAATRQLRQLLDRSPHRPRHSLHLRASLSQEGRR